MRKFDQLAMAARVRQPNDDSEERVRTRKVPGARREPVPAAPELTDKRPGSITDTTHTAGLVGVDLLATCAAMPVALVLLAWISRVPSNSMGRFSWNLTHDSLFPVAVLAALALSGTYRANRRDLGPSTFKGIHDLLFALGAACVLTIAVGALLHATTGFQEPWPTQLIVMVIVAVLFVAIGRSIISAILHALTVTRVIVVGAGPLPDRIATYIGLNKGLSLVGRVVDDIEPDDGAIGTVRDLPRLCEELHIKRVIVSYPDRMAHETIAVYRILQSTVHLTFVPRYFELVSWRSNLTDLSGLPLIEVAKADLSRWDRFLKRSLDIGLSLLTLIALSPLLLVVAFAIKVSSPGPILFRQARLGRRHHSFTILKFRSMNAREDPTDVMPLPADIGSCHDSSTPLYELRKKLDDGDRITKIGHLLRRSGLDELPQLFNVLRGDMSIVGPRPFVPHESFLEGWSARRFEVRPGITGLWQVSGRNELSTDDLRQLDYLYVASWSFWWDLKILFDTPRTMLHGFGAY
jgi:exopolysaccharide biosynthesis polyprenyl glycosylphosphotransferase